MKKITYILTAILLVCIVSAQEIDWDDPSEISIEDLAENPEKTRSVWSGLALEQKQQLYETHLSEFVDQLSEEKGIASLSGSITQCSYQGSILTNKGSSIDLDQLAGQNIEALQEGGFRIGNTDLRGDLSQITIEVLSDDEIKIGQTTTQGASSIEATGNSFNINGNSFSRDIGGVRIDGDKIIIQSDGIFDGAVIKSKEPFSLVQGVLKVKRGAIVELLYKEPIKAFDEVEIQQRDTGYSVSGKFFHAFSTNMGTISVPSVLEAKAAEKDICGNSIALCVGCQGSLTGPENNYDILWNGQTLEVKGKASVSLISEQDIFAAKGNVDGVVYAISERGVELLRSPDDEIESTFQQMREKKIAELEERIRSIQGQAGSEQRIESIGEKIEELERKLDKYDKLPLVFFANAHDDDLFLSQFSQYIKSGEITLDSSRMSKSGSQNIASYSFTFKTADNLWTLDSEFHALVEGPIDYGEIDELALEMAEEKNMDISEARQLAFGKVHKKSAVGYSTIVQAQLTDNEVILTGDVTNLFNELAEVGAYRKGNKIPLVGGLFGGIASGVAGMIADIEPIELARVSLYDDEILLESDLEQQKGSISAAGTVFSMAGDKVRQELLVADMDKIAEIPRMLAKVGMEQAGMQLESAIRSIEMPVETIAEIDDYYGLSLSIRENPEIEDSYVVDLVIRGTKTEETTGPRNSQRRRTTRRRTTEHMIQFPPVEVILDQNPIGLLRQEFYKVKQEETIIDTYNRVIEERGNI